NISRHRLPLVNYAAFHHPRDALELRNVAQWIAGDGDDVCELGALDRTDAIAPPHDLGARSRRRDDGCHRRLAEPHAVAELARVLAVRYHGGVGPEADREARFQHHLKRTILDVFDLARALLLG